MARELSIKVKKLSDNAELPEYMYESDVGLDFRSNEDATLKPMEQKHVKTGVAVIIPENHVGLIRDRAGIVSKMNVHTVAGTFDPEYRGEVTIGLVNLGENEVMIEKGMRIAQMIIVPAARVDVEEVDELPDTERSDKSFGSTGIKDRAELLKEIEDDLKQQHEMTGDE
ncbi:MAG TPA: dUTP diphosphatase [Candidatus Woesearchaeota archaeon]|nr:dUTP diphosphatase [Candidatus Woesearchaeota archaeon]